ncbi:unnamed protein product, partial [Onchocerca ochengi]|uniref:Sema domain-containing protein n=1 Tax=Onchocerca ochengi TaxID=42157 RepID=A0A182ELS0_ONCOC
MNLAIIVIITVLLNQRLIECQTECSGKNFKTALPDPDYVIFGTRNDTRVVLLPSSLINNSSIINKLPNLLEADILTTGKKIYHYDAMLIEVHGLLQFLTTWQEATIDGTFYMTTILSYFEGFRLEFVPTVDKIIHKTKLTTLMYFSDLQYPYYHFKTTKDSEVFFAQVVEEDNPPEQYQIVFGRAGTKLFVQETLKISEKWVAPTANFMAVNKEESNKWLARNQKSPTPQLDCVVETKSKFGVQILYGRKNLVNAYYEMGESAFDCNDEKCKEELRSNGGKTYHDKEIDPIHEKGSIYLGFRNGYIFSYRVINEKEKFSEILFSLDLSHQFFKDGKIGEDEELYLLSVDGKETIAVICGPVTYYRIFNTNPRNGIKVINLKKSEMTIVKQLKKKCRKVDYNAKVAKLIFFMDQSTAHELKLTYNHDGKLKTYSDPKL